MKRKVLQMIFLLIVTGSFKAGATVYTVTGTGDNSGTNPAAGAGTGTLRQAIVDVNADVTVAADTISFNIPGGGVQTIVLMASLPTLTRSNVVIDGYTQPGAAMGSFSGRSVMVQINGTVPVGFSFTILASNILYRGLCMFTQNNSGYAFLSVGQRSGMANNYSNVKIQGCFFNSTAAGTPVTPAPSFTVTGGVQVYGTVTANNTASAASNVIIGVDGDGVDDDKEGNLAACTTNNNGVFDLRDVDNCVVAGNWIGIQPDGVSLLNYLPGGNGGLSNYPVYLGNVTGSRIGTNGDGISDALERNVIADGSNAIYVTYNYPYGTNPSLSGMYNRAPGKNQVTGNYIGTYANGTTPTNRITTGGIILRGFGTYIGCDTNEVTSAALRNVITANQYAIYELAASASFQSVQSVIKGNNVGVGSDNITALPIGYTSASVGGYGILSASAAGSRIIGNTVGNINSFGTGDGQGIYILKNSTDAAAASGVTIQNNNIGILADNVTAAPVARNGIVINAGTAFTIKQNKITNSGLAGIDLRGGAVNSFATKQVTISQNSIWGNGGLGIDLEPGSVAGVTANDGAESASSSTTDPNLLMDYPVITSVSVSGTNLTVGGFVGSAAGQPQFANATVEFFTANNTPANQNGEVIAGDGRSVGHGEGQVYLGSLVTDASGNFSGTIDVTGKSISANPFLTATATDLSGNTSEFGADFSSYPLSLDLLSFDVAARDGSAVLSWQTATERNTDFFSIERSTDGATWAPLAQVKAGGNTNGTQEYGYTDYDPATGKNFYRLKMVDNDESYTYSPVRVADFNKEQYTGWSIYPNPATDALHIDGLTGVADAYVLNISGQEILHAVISPAQSKVDVDVLPSGSYFIKIRTADGQIKNVLFVKK